MADTLSILRRSLASRYRVHGELGRGGMSQVFDAEDVRHGRRVAIKVLAPEIAAAVGPARFLREISLAARLQHPNIVPLLDSGEAESLLYYTMPRIDGESLRTCLDREQQLPIEQAVQFARDVADALDYAHAKDVVHRDIKPENILISAGHALVTDFGIARVTQTEAAPLTTTGTQIGSPLYMSPEQVMADKNIDARSDVYSLGCVLYEMLAGQPPFTGPNRESVGHQILAVAPRSVREIRALVPAALESVVARALQKNRADRFASAREFHASLGQAITPLPARPTPDALVPSRPPRRARSAITPWRLALGVMLLAAVATAYFVGVRSARRSEPRFKALTFARGIVHAARFTPDGQTMIYSASWDGGSERVYSTRPEFPESRPIAEAGTRLLSVSSRGELAVLTGIQKARSMDVNGTLSRVPLEGGVPRAMAENIHTACWDPGGKDLLVTRRTPDGTTLESPPGHVLYRWAGWVSDARVSPNGDRIAFIEYAEPILGTAVVAIVDMDGRHRKLTEPADVRGLAWSPNGKDILFGGRLAGEGNGIYAVSLGGRLRKVFYSPEPLVLHDLHSNGTALVSVESIRRSVVVRDVQTANEHDLTWLNHSWVGDLSRDGDVVLLGDNPGAGLRATDGSPVLALGDGLPLTLSPDGRWAATVVSERSDSMLVLHPTGPGTSRHLPTPGLHGLFRLVWLPDGERVVFTAHAGSNSRCFVQSIASGAPTPITEPGTRLAGPPTPDGRFVPITDEAGHYFLAPLGKDQRRRLHGIEPLEQGVQWDPRGRDLFVYHFGDPRVFKVNVETGNRELWQEIAPNDRAGIDRIANVRITRDGRVLAFDYRRTLSTLYVVEGLTF